MTLAGQVVAVWRHPVKSMQGVRIDGAPIGEAGLLGDRPYAVRDVEMGLSASAKHPQRWAAVFACRAVYQHAARPGDPLPPVEITVPGGATVSSADPAVNEQLSTALGRAVRLVTAHVGGTAYTHEADRSPQDTRPVDEGRAGAAQPP